ncbi:hypothetical protein BKA70DRAFT_1115517, partial [Coprinopsis sp. MPI-PUGE-AT-0042]
SHRRNREPVFEWKSFYGQLEYLYLVELPPSAAFPFLNPDAPTRIALAMVRQTNVTRSNVSGLDIHAFKDTKKVDIVDITTVKCLVARASWNKEKFIFDRSGSLARVLPEYEDN